MIKLLKVQIKKVALQAFSLSRNAAQQNLYSFTFLVLLGYMLLFQLPFMSSGDIWAEAFYEYVYGFVIAGWNNFFEPGIAGYFNFLPKIFSYGYLSSPLSEAYIDYFFRIITVVFAIACISFIAHQSNRHIIRSDLLRTVLALLVLMTFYHISSFSFINIWYVGFIPIILVSLSPKAFAHEWQQVAYAAFAMSVCFTKPSAIIIPLVVYRMLRHREFLLGGIILFSIALQLGLFFTSDFYHSSTQAVADHFSIIEKLVSACLYPGLMLLKLLEIFPSSFLLLICAVIATFILGFVTVKARGWLEGLVIGSVIFLISYTALFPPDMAPVSVIQSYELLYMDQMKLQREPMAYFFLLLMLFLAIQLVTNFFTTNLKRVGLITAGLLAVITLVIYRPIEVNSSNLFVNIDPYRQALSIRAPVCMPIPPTPSWVPSDYNGGPTYGWYYESRGLGTCQKTNYEKSLDYQSFTSELGKGSNLTITGFSERKLVSILLVVSNPTPSKPATLIIENSQTHESYEAEIVQKPAGKNDALNFVAFHMPNEKYQPHYTYTIYQAGVESSELRLGEFKDNSPGLYSYFLDISY